MNKLCIVQSFIKIIIHFKSGGFIGVFGNNTHNNNFVFCLSSISVTLSLSL